MNVGCGYVGCGYLSVLQLQRSTAFSPWLFVMYMYWNSNYTYLPHVCKALVAEWRHLLCLMYIDEAGALSQWTPACHGSQWLKRLASRPDNDSSQTNPHVCDLALMSRSISNYVESTLREYNSPRKLLRIATTMWGALLMEQPLPQCWSTNHVPSWICIFSMFTV